MSGVKTGDTVTTDITGLDADTKRTLKMVCIMTGKVVVEGEAPVMPPTGT